MRQVSDGDKAKTLKERIRYDSVTGEFFNLVTKKRAGSIKHNGRNKQYIVLRFNDFRISGHRAAWFLYYGEFPLSEIDHVNGDSLDNRIQNLRLSNRHGNMQNQVRPHSNNSTGYLGVCRQNGKFAARIQISKKSVFLGYFDTPEEAHIAYVYTKRKVHSTCTI